MAWDGGRGLRKARRLGCVFRSRICFRKPQQGQGRGTPQARAPRSAPLHSAPPRPGGPRGVRPRQFQSVTARLPRVRAGPHVARGPARFFRGPHHVSGHSGTLSAASGAHPRRGESPGPRGGARGGPRASGAGPRAGRAGLSLAAPLRSVPQTRGTCPGRAFSSAAPCSGQISRDFPRTVARDFPSSMAPPNAPGTARRPRSSFFSTSRRRARAPQKKKKKKAAGLDLNVVLARPQSLSLPSRASP